MPDSAATNREFVSVSQNCSLIFSAPNDEKDTLMATIEPENKKTIQIDRIQYREKDVF